MPKIIQEDNNKNDNSQMKAANIYIIYMYVYKANMYVYKAWTGHI